MQAARQLFAIVLLLVSSAYQCASQSSLSHDDLRIKCGYCMATAEVLSKRIETEKPRNHLDFRGRLDGDGVRFGKILDFRLSELRIIELLEDLSEDLEAYREVEQEADQPLLWQHQDMMSGNRSSAPEVEQKHNRKLMKRWCDHVIEKNEDALTQYLKSDAVSPAGIQDLLCTRLTGLCQAAARDLTEL